MLTSCWLLVGVLTAGCDGRIADDPESAARAYLEAVRLVDHGQVASLVAAADLDRFATVFRRLLAQDSTGALLSLVHTRSICASKVPRRRPERSS
ncbi:MAG: hypothetical protein AB7R55_12540 [Gemmatimonadales bacterium]